MVRRDEMLSPDEALERFVRSTGSFLALIEGVSAGDWDRRPSGEAWSIGETVEHVVLTNQATLTRFHEQLETSPIEPNVSPFPDGRITEQMFRAAGPAPPGLAEPTGRFATASQGIAALTAACDGIAGYVRATAPRLRDFALPHPVFGMFDGVQWVLFVGAHTDNHIPQLLRLRELTISSTRL